MNHHTIVPNCSPTGYDLVCSSKPRDAKNNVLAFSFPNEPKTCPICHQRVSTPADLTVNITKEVVCR